MFHKVWYIIWTQNELTLHISSNIFCSLFSIHESNVSFRFVHLVLHLFKNSPSQKCMIVFETTLLEHWGMVRETYSSGWNWVASPPVSHEIPIRHTWSNLPLLPTSTLTLSLSIYIQLMNVSTSRIKTWGLTGGVDVLSKSLLLINSIALLSWNFMRTINRLTTVKRFLMSFSWTQNFYSLCFHCKTVSLNFWLRDCSNLSPWALSP